MYTRIVLKILLIYLLNMHIIMSVTSVWIDIPQFSDDSKVYKVPLIKSSRHKIHHDRFHNIDINPVLNRTKIITDRSKQLIQVPLTVNTEITTLSHPIATTNDNVEEHTKIIKELLTIANSNITISANVKNELVTTNPQIVIDDCNVETNETLTDNITNIEGYKITFFNSEKSNGTGPWSFFQYLPIELIKRVHATLLGRAQKTIQDKQNFLKTFEKSILHKLESRLVPIFNSVRSKRGSSWDDHHDHVGFPSLEGALLAISFLTFAVYLIQLVMMLMRNFGNNGNNPNTLLVNRNKRSVPEFFDDSVRILEYLDTFSKN